MRISDWSSDVCSSDLSEKEHHHAIVSACPPPTGLRSRRIPNNRATASRVRSPPPRHRVRSPCPLPYRTYIQAEKSEWVHAPDGDDKRGEARSEEHTSELQSLMRTSYAVFSLTKKTN